MDRHCDRFTATAAIAIAYTLLKSEACMIDSRIIMRSYVGANFSYHLMNVFTLKLVFVHKL